MMTLLIADPFEPNDSFGTATPLDQSADAYIARNGDEDFYRWVATESGRLNVDMLFGHSEGDLDLYLYDSRGRELDRSISVTNNERVSGPVTAGSTYFIRVVGDVAPPFGGTTCSGRFCTHIPTVPRTTSYRIVVGGPTDNNDQISEATRRAIGSTSNGTISPTGGDVDMQSFSVRSGQRIAFDVDRSSGSALDSYLRLFDASGRQLAFSDDAAAPGETRGLDSYLEYTFRSSGTYYVGISSYGNSSYNAISGGGDRVGSTGAYTIEFSFV